MKEKTRAAASPEGLERGKLIGPNEMSFVTDGCGSADTSTW